MSLSDDINDNDVQDTADTAGPEENAAAPTESTARDESGLLPEGEERPRRSKKATTEAPATPSGWRTSRRSSKTSQRARKEAKTQATREKVAEGARDTGQKVAGATVATGKLIAGVALALLIVVLLITGINGLARWNAKRIAEAENSPEALLEKARDNLLIVSEEEGKATGFLALKVDGETEQIYGIAIPDAAFMEVPGRGFQRIGESYDSGPEVTLSAVTNFFNVPFSTYVVVPPEIYQTALTQQSVLGLLEQSTDTNLTEEEMERWISAVDVVDTSNVALLPMPVKPINVGSQTYFEPQRDEVADLIEQWWGVSISGGDDVVRVIVYNGSGEPGIAGDVAQELIAGGYRVVDTKNADSFDYAETQVIVQTSDARIGERLAQLLGTGVVTVQEADQDVAEVIVIIGQDLSGDAVDE